ncbi:MAG: N-acetylmuramoyl-L-alanine amidase, partial [Bacteroidales bacterium]|nr:N-acetylmuramoyl-L-alanine amidase [Bacteroidales bacterium]
MSCPLLQSQVKDNIRTVVIDAGHGGHDPGCLGTKSKEKDVALSVALKVGKLISDKHSDVKVIYTRSTDVFVELFRRAQIANNQHADLFISIHCNASESKTARGTETYVMGLKSTAANLAVAKKENSAILLEKNYENNYEGFDPTSPETNIIFSLYTAAYLKNSSLLASKVQNNLIAVNHFPDR